MSERLPPSPSTPAGSAAKRRLVVVVNADWFFVSHRLRLGAACRDAGYDVHVCAGESEARATIEAEGFTFHPLPIDRGGTNPRRDAKTIAALFSLYRRLRPDVVHHVTIKPVLYGSLAARAVGVPAIVNAVSGLGYVFIPRERPSVRHALLRGALENTYRVALGAPHCRVIFQNESDRARFVESRLVDEKRTVIIHGSGVDANRFGPSPLPEGNPLVVLPARLLWDKGVGEFVEAARALKKQRPEVRFALVGRVDPGNPASVPEPTVTSWVREGIVEWWGSVPVADMPSVYRQASLVVLPSYREGLPLVLAEAAASGRACVTTDVPGCRDALLPNETGWLVPDRDAKSLASAILLALSDRQVLEQRSAAAVRFANMRFRQERVFEETLRIYDELAR